jgi:hypothetical protein
MDNTMEFKPFPKLSRLSRDMVITEKLDGTNAQIYITDDDQFFVGSRTRWITPEQDNFGFARWAHEHEDELRAGLGYGQHFGEWWGQGIQRKYGLDEKRFSLFNTGRWNADNIPDCCHVVPVLWAESMFNTTVVDDVLHKLHNEGSVAAPGFMKPEGIVIYLVHSRQLFKKTLDHNDEHKFMHENDPRS